MPSSTYAGLSINDVDKAKRNWQKTALGQLPNLFIAFDEQTNESKRVVSFQLEASSVNDIATIGEGVKHLVVHLGSRESASAKLVDIPDTPFFTPILELRMVSGDRKFYPFAWVPNPSFLDSSEDVNSRREAIPGASAYLFILSWLEKKFRELHEPFIGLANGKNQRVKTYVFEEVESAAIIELIKEEGMGAVNLYMGNGIRVSSHPFAFRPIIEVAKDVNTFIEDGSSFYDFCNPCPPYCGEG